MRRFVKQAIGCRYTPPEQCWRDRVTKNKTSLHAIVEAAQALSETQGWYNVTPESIARKARVRAAVISGRVARAAYTPVLMCIVEAAESSTPREESSESVRDFFLELANVAAQYPVLATALHEASISAGDSREAQKATTEIVVIDFDRLAECLGVLLTARLTGRKYLDPKPRQRCRSHAGRNADMDPATPWAASG